MGAERRGRWRKRRNERKEERRRDQLVELWGRERDARRNEVGAAYQIPYELTHRVTQVSQPAGQPGPDDLEPREPTAMGRTGVAGQDGAGDAAGDERSVSNDGAEACGTGQEREGEREVRDGREREGWTKEDEVEARAEGAAREDEDGEGTC